MNRHLSGIVGIFVALPAVFVVATLLLHFATKEKGSFPLPVDIVTSIPKLFQLDFEKRVYFGEAIRTTVYRVLLATGLSAIVGGLFALALSWKTWIWGLAQPTVDLTRSIPTTFFVPVLALVSGSTAAYLPWFLASIPCALIMLLQVRQGIENIDKFRIHTFYVLMGSKSPIRALRYVIIPEIMPEFIAGLRLASSYAIVVVSVLEYFAVGSQKIGFGFLIAHHAQYSTNDPRIFAGILVFGIFGLLLNKILEMIENRVTRWRSDNA